MNYFKWKVNFIVSCFFKEVKVSFAYWWLSGLGDLSIVEVNPFLWSAVFRLLDVADIMTCMD
tara:strand:- start:262 stop:447 length:186 start_codon:yes stop_codon:yes gene_type:complete